MSILKENWKDLIKASSVQVNYLGENEASISVEALEMGYGMTLGNSLRRILLSSIRGFAVTSVKIDGIFHEYSAIDGIKEDVFEIIMNIKSLVIKKETPAPTKIHLKADKKGVVRASDITVQNNVEILNKDLVICTMEKDNVSLNIEMTVENGVGYRPASFDGKEEKVLGVIDLDVLFSPVKKVSYKVSNARIGQRTDYNKLVMNIKTDGTVKPEDALGLAAKILQTQLEPLITFDVNEHVEEDDIEDDQDHINPNLLKKIDEMELSVRSYNCLKNENIAYIGDLVQKTETEMLKMPNFGRKSLNELKDNLKAMDLTFGMKIDDWSREKAEKILEKKR